MPEVTTPADADIWLPKLLAEAGLVTSNSEGRRMVKQGAVRIDGEPVSDETVSRDQIAGHVVQVGKRRFVRFV